MARKRYEIAAWRQKVEVELKDVLEAFGRDFVESRIWVLDDDDLKVAGTPDAALASRRPQIIDGILTGRKTGEESSDVEIRAIDSSHSEVAGGDQTLAAFVLAFPDARAVSDA